MINFRFHLVSLIAVFLALALGVVVGSTVIDRAIVDGLEAQIDRVERNAEEQRRDNNELRQRVERLEVFEEQVAPFVLEDRLPDVPVVLMATRGVDEDAVRGLVAAMRRAGAAAPAIIWLEPSWALVEPEPRQALRELFDRPDGGGDVLRRTALTAVARRIQAGGTGESVPATTTTAAETTTTTAAEEVPEADDTTSTTAPELPDVDVFDALEDVGLIAFDRAGAAEVDRATYPGPGARVVAVSGPAARVSAEVLFLPLVTALAEEALLTLAADVPSDDAEEAAAETVGLVRGNGELVDEVSTVDSVDRLIGRLASVLALEELGRGQVGHYGLGPGASRQLPEIPEA